MKNHKKDINKMALTLLMSTVFLLLSVVPVLFGAVSNEYQVQVPLVIDLSHSIAGAQFAFEYTAGLEFVSYEKSDSVSSALTTPVVVKDGHTHVGFYNTDNKYMSKEGKLDMGYLVFNRLSDNPQQVTITEIKLVQITDSGATHSEFLTPVEIKISPEKGNVSSINNSSRAAPNDTNVSSANNNSGTPNDTKITSIDDKSSVTAPNDTRDLQADKSEDPWLLRGFWIALGFLFVVVCCVGIFISTKKRVNAK